jgi:hypothetical protein
MKNLQILTMHLPADAIPLAYVLLDADDAIEPGIKQELIALLTSRHPREPATRLCHLVEKMLRSTDRAELDAYQVEILTMHKKAAVTNAKAWIGAVYDTLANDADPMTPQAAVDSLIAITRNLSPAAKQLALTPLTGDQKLPANVREGITAVLLKSQMFEPATRLNDVLAELIVLTKYKPAGSMARTAEIWKEIDRMDARATVAEVYCWWASVQNIVADGFKVDA